MMRSVNDVEKIPGGITVLGSHKAGVGIFIRCFDETKVSSLHPGCWIISKNFNRALPATVKILCFSALQTSQGN
jgi:hypothetical protein